MSLPPYSAEPDSTPLSTHPVWHAFQPPAKVWEPYAILEGSDVNNYLRLHVVHLGLKDANGKSLAAKLPYNVLEEVVKMGDGSVRPISFAKNYGKDRQGKDRQVIAEFPKLREFSKPSIANLVTALSDVTVTVNHPVGKCNVKFSVEQTPKITTVRFVVDIPIR